MDKQKTIEEAKLRAANYMSLKGALEPKQETLEEAGVAYAKTVNENHTSHMLGFYNGAKWQQEKMYELVEEYNQMLIDPNVHEDHREKSFKEWFEQFKKK